MTAPASRGVYADVRMEDVVRLLRCSALLPGPRRCRQCNGAGGGLSLTKGPLSFGFIVDVACTACAGKGEVCADCGRAYVYDGVNKDSCKGRLAR